MTTQRQARLLKRTGIILLLVSAAFLLGQVALRWGANYYLRERARLPVRIGRLFINPATSQVTLGFKGAEPGQMLLLDLGRIRFDWWTVILKRLRLGNVRLADIQLSVRRDKTGRLFVGDINIPTEQVEAPAKAPAHHGKPWGVGVGAVDLSNLRILYEDTEIKLDVTLLRFHMDGAESWHPWRNSHFEGEFLINGGHLSVSGEARPFAKTIGAETTITLDELPLDWILPLLKTSGVSKLKGALSSRLKIEARYTPDTGIAQAVTDGTVSFSSVTVAAESMAPIRVTLNGPMRLDSWHVEASTSTPLQVQAKALELGPQFRLTLFEPSLNPPFHFTIAPLSVLVENIDTTHSDAVTRFTIKAKTGKFEDITIKGQGAPLARYPDGDLDFVMKGVNVTPLTSYSTRYAGYRVASGQFTVKTKALARAGLLKADTDFLANKFYLEKLKADELDGADKQIGLPLNLCLALLRDADDNIRLKVPVEGDLRDPKLSVGKMVWQILGKALLSALRNAALAFFPSGSHMGFEAVLFVPSSAQLSGDGQTYLKQVGAKLIDRPQVSIRLTGHASASDVHSTVPLDLTKLSNKEKDHLLTLAGQRAAAVQTYLAEQEKIDVKRLLLTPPTIDPSPEAKPQTELSLAF